jgi:hypothetical protein
MYTTLYTPELPSVSWFDWAPNPDRAFRDHNPALEPFASMNKQQLLDAMLDASSGPEWDFLQEFFLDRCTPAELAVSRLTFLRQQFGDVDDDLYWFLSGVAGFATRVSPGRFK